MTKNEYLTK